jgi:acetylornithine deacetylase
MQGLQDEGVVPPYSTLNIGQFRGGVAHNVIPEAAQVIWQLRAVPSGDAQEVVSKVHDVLAELSAEMSAFDPACGIDIEPLIEVPSLAQEANGAAEALAARLTGQNGTVAVTFGTEAGIFQRAGFSTVVCGPGSIEQAHMENEYVEDQQLQMCCNMLEHLARSLT